MFLLIKSGSNITGKLANKKSSPKVIGSLYSVYEKEKKNDYSTAIRISLFRILNTSILVYAARNYITTGLLRFPALQKLYS